MTICPNCKAQNPDDNAFCANCGKPLKAGATPAPTPAPDVASDSMADLSGLQTISFENTRDHGWRQPADDSPLEAGTVFAERYTIEGVIGRGGMGVVYRAKDAIGDRLVALKLIRSDLLGGEPAVKRLIGEGVLTQDIRHKNIVNVYNVGQDHGQPFVAMEFAEGTSLREWIRQQVAARAIVPMRVAARIIAEILDGLDAAHAMGVVHRDLKPENVILTGTPDDKAAPLKILDFGIARAAGKMESGTTGIGTLGYMPPEQRTNPEAAGPSADLYSVSVMFYELLVEVLPQGHWQPPSGGRADVTPKIDELIERGLSNRPGNRPQTAKEYREQLVDAVNSAGPVAIGVDQVKKFFDPKAAQDMRASLLKKPWVKWTLIVVGILAVIGGISQIVQGLNGGSGTSSDTTTTFDQTTQVRTPPASSYAALNGQWLSDNGASYAIQAQPNGAFGGSGVNAEGVASAIQGQFNGGTARYVWSGPGISLQGQATWDGHDCHVDFLTYNPDGSINLSGRFHINHQPGAPCP